MLLLLGILVLASPIFGQRGLCEQSQNGEACFQLVTRFANFYGARRTCQSMGGDLASILNEPENRIIADHAHYLANTGVNTNIFWIGGTFPGFCWRWTDGRQMFYGNFANPNDLYRPQYPCLSMLATDRNTFYGLWMPVFCDGIAPFVCELVKRGPVTTTPQPITTTKPPTTTTAAPTRTTEPTTTVAQTTTSVKPTTTAPTTTQRPHPGYRKLCEDSQPGEKCFHIVGTRANFPRAREACQAIAGDLASILNERENRIIADKVHALAPIYRSNVFWIGGFYNNFSWGWLDGNQMIFTKFASPDDFYNPFYNCLSMIANDGNNFYGLWMSVFCDGLAPFVCEIVKRGREWEWNGFRNYKFQCLAPTTTPKPTTTTPAPTTTTTTAVSKMTTTQAPTSTVTEPTTTTATTELTQTTASITPTPSTTIAPSTTAGPNLCDESNYFCFQNHAYFINRNPLSWEQAEDFCVGQKGHLVSILNQAESDFVAIFLRFANIDLNVWIGGFRTDATTFHWIDGSAWGFTNWFGGQPNSDPNNNCVEVFDANYKHWVNYDCSREFVSVCKIPV
ncbi:hypothetical protein L596_011877 [Steinernema carpocapsae]|uniref:C-type lectin domain-containing protein n=1 Tax=Steinernema carpocapsae TaxID=34508 RepID=A0A4U5NVC1_STECR|nr:hypothetical protein L596_011877 [Steinernema carpocapsae]